MHGIKFHQTLPQILKNWETFPQWLLANSGKCSPLHEVPSFNHKSNFSDYVFLAEWIFDSKCPRSAATTATSFFQVCRVWQRELRFGKIFCDGFRNNSWHEVRRWNWRRGGGQGMPGWEWQDRGETCCMVPGEVLYSQGTVAHHKQDMFSIYDTACKTYIFFCP